MKTYISADLHLNHKKIIDYCPATRSHFTDHIEMTESIIANWNNTVAPDDEVWILGDVSMGHPDMMHVYIPRLNGTKRLIAGNHDTKILSDEKLQSYFASIEHYKELTVSINGQEIVVCMSHRPMNHWHKKQSGSIMLHGHCHAIPTNIPGRIKDIGLDTNNIQLYVFEDIVAEVAKLPI